MSFFCYQITTIFPIQSRCARRFSKRDILYTNNTYCQEQLLLVIVMPMGTAPIAKTVLAVLKVKYLNYSGSRNQIQDPSLQQAHSYNFHLSHIRCLKIIGFKSLVSVLKSWCFGWRQGGTLMYK